MQFGNLSITNRILSFFFSAQNRPQDLAYTRQVLYHRAAIPALFLSNNYIVFPHVTDVSWI